MRRKWWTNQLRKKRPRRVRHRRLRRRTLRKKPSASRREAKRPKPKPSSSSVSSSSRVLFFTPPAGQRPRPTLIGRHAFAASRNRNGRIPRPEWNKDSATSIYAHNYLKTNML